MNRTRVEWLDNAKGIGILLVVIGHSIITPIRDENSLMNLIYSCIYYFHMPFMMFLSGMSFQLFQRKDIGRFAQVKKKAKQLLIPYISYSCLVALLVWVLAKIPIIGPYMMNAGYLPKPILAVLIEILIGGNTYAIHLWYLYALFIFYVLHILTEGWLKNYHHVLIGVILFAIKCIVNTDDLYIINSICTLYFWFAIGSCVRINIHACESLRKGNWRTVVAIAITACYVICDIMFLPTPENPILYTVHTVIKFTMIYIFFIGIVSICMSEKMHVLHIYNLGIQSYSIYLFHQPFICLCGVTVLNMVLPGTIAVIIGVIMSISIPILINKILGQKYMKGLRLLLMGR